MGRGGGGGSGFARVPPLDPLLRTLPEIIVRLSTLTESFISHNSECHNVDYLFVVLHDLAS